MNAAAGSAPAIDETVLSRRGLNWLAFSGGPDSLCLLHLLLKHGFGDTLRVVHIDHALDADSGARAARAEALARSLGVACRVERLHWQHLSQHGGPEQAARNARYARLQSLIAEHDHVLTGHHGDDQAETVLLRLLRGAGPDGLAGMRPLRPLPPGRLGRPLLAWSRGDIIEYLDCRGLQYLHDPSNTDQSLDRNYLRHAVLPLLAARWPACRSSIRRSAQWMGAASNALNEQAAADLQRLARTRVGSGENVLDLPSWLQLPPARACAVIRQWCRKIQIEAPPTRRLEEFRAQCTHHGLDRQPLLDWAAARLHTYRRQLWLDVGPQLPQDWAVDWNEGSEISLPVGGCWSWQGPPPSDFGRNWRIGPPEPGARLRLHPDGPARKAVGLLSEDGIPPWRRHAIACLYIEGRLCSVGTDWLDVAFKAWMASHDAVLAWHQRPATLLPCRPKR